MNERLIKALSQMAMRPSETTKRFSLFVWQSGWLREATTNTIGPTVTIRFGAGKALAIGQYNNLLLAVLIEPGGMIVLENNTWDSTFNYERILLPCSNR